MHPQQFKNVLSLSSEERYGYLLRKVAETEEVWLIRDAGSIVMLGENEGAESLPVFPEEEFASILLTGDWQNYRAEKMSVYEFIDGLDSLQEDNIFLAGFPKDYLTAVLVSPEEMKDHLLYELQRYE